MKHVVILSSYTWPTEKPSQNFRKVSNFVFLQILAKEQRGLLTKKTGDDLSNEVGRNQKRRGILVSRSSQRYSNHTDKKNDMSQAVMEKSLDDSIRTESSSELLKN